VTNRCTYCGTGDQCQCALDHIGERKEATPGSRARDAQHLLNDLRQIPDLYANLHMFLVRGATGEGIIGGPSGSRPPMDLGVVDLMDEREKRNTDPARTEDERARDQVWGTRRQGVLPTLSSWVRLVDSERWDEGDEHQNPPTQRTVLGECGWLIESMDWIGAQRWVDEMAADIRQIRNDLRKAIRDRDVKDELVCTKCQWKVIEVQAEKGTWFECTGCSEKWGRIELHKMAERKRPRPLKECAEVTGHPHRTLRYLVAEGLLKHVARDGNRNLYDIQDVVVAAAQVKIRGVLA
jgi:hypothetical protein